MRRYGLAAFRAGALDTTCASNHGQDSEASPAARRIADAMSDLSSSEVVEAGGDS